MHGIFSRRPPRALFIFASLALLGGCGETPLASADWMSATIGSANTRAVDLGGCDSLAAAEGSVLVAKLYADGAQIYRWDGAKWVFVAPSARLFGDANATGVIGNHYAGPTWETLSGSKVVGSVIRRCIPDPNSIPWLLLSATSSGPGLFAGVDQIQRLNTRGGLAPAQPGSTVGELANVPYTAEYQFYRSE